MSILYLGCWFLLALLLDATTFDQPQTVELDLTFPRNETYAPSPIFPILWTIQNSLHANPLDIQILYDIANAQTWDGGSGDVLDIGRDKNLSTSDPYFLSDFSVDLNTEATWMLRYTVLTLLCPKPGSSFMDDEPVSFGDPVQTNALYFTTKKRAKQPDLAAAADSDTCAQIPSTTFNITGTMDVSGYDFEMDPDSCASISPSTPSPAPNPCQVQVPSATASSIMAGFTSSVCIFPDPVVSCPPTETATGTNPAPRPGHFPIGETWMIAILGWLAYTLV